ncbi:MAG: tryptophan-rich sensory protein [Actinomycetales bacterium]|nr:tryptophan-rich sensory protein [Actinomycetales bacterium]
MAWRTLAAVAAVALVVAYAVGSGRWVSTGSTWYLSLAQPAWQPPPWVFGVIWPYNFTMLAVLGVVISLRAPAGRVALWLVALAASAAFAVAWAYLFYGPHALLAAAVSLSLAAVITGVLTWVAAERSGWALLAIAPYQVWVVLAASLSWGYVALHGAGATGVTR